jgi:hypothetical protein
METDTQANSEQQVSGPPTAPAKEEPVQGGETAVSMDVETAQQPAGGEFLKKAAEAKTAASRSQNIASASSPLPNAYPIYPTNAMEVSEPATAVSSS